jgi:hypothetical protein
MSEMKQAEIAEKAKTAHTASAVSQQRGLTPWPKGTSGNVLGRKPGSRNRINEAFLVDLEDIWRRRGPEMMEKAATAEPMQFVKMVAGLQPSKIESELTVNNTFAQFNLTDPREFAAAWEIARKVVYGQAPMIEADEGVPVTEAWRADDA